MSSVLSRGAYNQRAAGVESYKPSSWVAAILVLWAVLLVACGGGGGGSSSGGSGSEGDEQPSMTTSTDAILEIIPTGNSFNITLRNYQSLFNDNNITEISITAITGTNRQSRTISISNLTMSDGKFVLAGLMSGQRYSFEMAVVYINGSRSDYDIDFFSQQHRQDHASGGILLAANQDGNINDANTGNTNNDNTNNNTNTGNANNDNTNNNTNTGNTNNDNTNNNTNTGNANNDNTNNNTNTGNTNNDNTNNNTNTGNTNNNNVVNNDRDDDGVDNDDDNCPDHANQDQKNSDTDGLGDACDDDDDGDSHADAVDVDDDGDGLIEIATVWELGAVRHQLNGSGLKLTETGGRSTTGCPTDGCKGYELVADIDMSIFSNWRPIGRTVDITSTSDDGLCNDSEVFSSIFDGNDRTISGLTISRPDENCVGLFGSIDSSSEIRQLHLEIERIEGRDNVGGLVGHANGARILSSSVTFDRINGRRQVGGLVGSGDGMTLASSVVLGNRVMGSSYEIGGMIGKGSEAVVRFSQVVLRNISGTTNIGGVIGKGEGAGIFSSSAVIGGINGERRIGGLIGDGESTSTQDSGVTKVISSFAIVDRIYGLGRGSPLVSDVGGLIGDGTSSVVVSSYSIAGDLDGGGDEIGGLLGDGARAKLAYSYAVSGHITGASSGSFAGLIGGGSGDTLEGVYWDKEISGIENPTSDLDKTTSQLKQGAGFIGIYETWGNGFDSDGSGEIDDHTIWCDENLSGVIEADEKRTLSHRGGDNRIWVFSGTPHFYPAIRCTMDNEAVQHIWWDLNSTTNRPQLNQNRLNEVLGGT